MLWLSCIGALVTASPFLTVWRTTTANESISLPFSSPPVNLNISWGDGATQIVNNTATHVYSVAGLYNMSITGKFSLSFNSQQPMASKLMEIVSWGDGFTMDGSTINAFAGCVNLQVSAPGQPVITGGAKLSGMFMNTSINIPLTWDLANVTMMDDVFRGAKSLNQPIVFLNTLGVMATRRMFQDATAFNQNLTMQFDNVIFMESMFQGATSFNQPVNFNTGKARYMSYMFYGATAFNQPINFNGSCLLQTDYMFGNTATFNNTVYFSDSVEGSGLATTSGMFYNATVFNLPFRVQTDDVLFMDYMFAHASVFNQPLAFNTSRVQAMQQMFAGASKFNQPINFNTTSLNSTANMFAQATSFNSPVNFTTTSALTSTSSMFQDATAFQQPITFQTNNVITMDLMFSGASNFNQPVSFNTRKVQTMQSMFANAVAFNQPINFDATSLRDASMMFSGARAFNSVVNLANATNFTNTQGMFQYAQAFNQVLGFNITGVRNMSSMFKNASAFNRPLPWPSTDTRNVLSMASMFEDAVSFNQPINFQVDKLVTADNLLRGATSFNWPVVLLGSNNLTSMARMLANATAFSQIVNVSSTANVVSMKDMFMNSLGFEQDLRSWNVSKVTDCSNFCYWCGLPSFSMCVPCPTGQILSASGMDVCNCPPNEFNISTTQCAAVSVAPTSPAPTAGVPSATGESALCTLVQVGSALQVECISESSSPSPSSRGFLTGIISPLFNITHANDDNTSNEFVFTLPIDPQLFVSVGKITQPCESQQLSCEWQDPNTLEFLRSGCTVSKERVDMGSGVVGTECTCTHLTVFAIALRSELQLAPLCHAQEVDYVLMALYAILGVGLTMQVARILRSLLATRLASRSSGPRPVSSSSATSFSPPPAAVAAAQISIIQHSLMLLVCVLRIVYVATKPVVGSLAGLVALGLLPSAITLSLFIHLLLTWAGLQFATFEASPFARFRVPFVIMTLLVFAVVIVLTVLVGVAPEVDTVRDGSYVLAALYAIVCVLVLLSGLGMRKSISVVDALRATDWRVVFRCRLLVVTVGLSSCLFLVACLWVAAVQTDIVTSSAATLATTISFYVFDWLSLCVLMWLFSFGVKEVIETHQREVKEPPRSNRAPSSRSASASHRRDTSSRQDNSARNQAIEL